MNATFKALVIFALILAVLGGYQALAADEAIVLATQGNVEHVRQGAVTWDKSEANLILKPGDQLRTGPRSRATVKLSDLSIVRLGESTHLLIPSSEPKQSGFNLFRGLLYYFHRDNPGQFPVKTPTVSAVVRGTEFNIHVAENGATTLTLIDGRVSLTNEFGGQDIVSGEQASILADQPPRKTAVLYALNTLQWALYYPSPLDLSDLGPAFKNTPHLGESLRAYSQGDLLLALQNHPLSAHTNLQSSDFESDAERIYFAALLLASGNAGQSLVLLDQAQDKDQFASVKRGIRKLIAAVQFDSSEVPSPHHSDRTATEWLGQSYLLQSRSQLEQARQAAREALARNPDFAFARVQLAELEFSFGRADSSALELEKALSLAPRHAQALALRGFTLAAQNHLEAARQEFEHAIQVDPGLGNAWLGRGLVLIRQGEAQAGRLSIQVAATVEPNRAVFRGYLGKAFQHDGDLTRAAHEIELAKTLDANDPTAWLYAALLKQRRNQVNAAVGDLERSQALNDNRSVYRSRFLLDQDRAVRAANLASVYQDAGLREPALRAASESVYRDYANYSAHFFLANSYNALRDPHQINLRYETAWLSEYLLGNLLAPVGAGSLSPYVTQQEYTPLFESDRAGFASSTDYYSRGDWLQTAVFHGRFGNTGYALDSAYRNENGYRPNNQLEQLTLSLQVKHQITPNDTVYTQGGYYESESGDLTPYYDPAMAAPGLSIKERQEPLLLAGYHHLWSPGHHTLFLAGRFNDRLRLYNPAQPVLLTAKVFGIDDFAAPDRLKHEYRSDLDIYSFEAQQIATLSQHTFLLGARYQFGEIQSFSRHELSSVTMSPPAFFLPEYSQGVRSEMNRITLYAYDLWSPFRNVTFIGGLNFSRLEYPRNHRYAPLQDGEETAENTSPKAGLIWSPFTNTTLRAAYTRSLGGVSFDQSFQLEPSQIAGLSQSFRGLAPEAVTGANAASEFETMGLAWDQKFTATTYFNLTGEILRSDARRQLGAYYFNPFPPFLPTATPETLDFEERSLQASIHQLLGENFALSLGYRLTESTLENRFPEIPAAAAGGLLDPDQDLQAILHQVRSALHFNHSSGFFAMGEALWYNQSNRGYSPNIPGDDFWSLNAFAGYRFWQRRAEIRAGLLNIGGQDYRLNPLNSTPELYRDRTLVLSCRLNF